MAFDQQHLTDLGFVGSMPLRALQPKCADVPDRPGIYAVTLQAGTPAFLARSVGGRFKGKDPTVPVGALETKWLDDTETVYIGRASSLRDRLGLLARFGRGDAVGHWGGRYLWQISALDELRVCWRLESDPVDAERELLDGFEATMGRLPFANLVRGTRAAVAA
jgi:hypothetical protein